MFLRLHAPFAFANQTTPVKDHARVDKAFLTMRALGR